MGDAGLAAATSSLRAAGCVYAVEEARLIWSASPDPAARLALLERRVAGEPIEWLLGTVEFAGQPLEVGTGAFVPRRRTELLARLAAARARRIRTRPAVVVELCCGVAPVAAYVAARVPSAEVHAADIDPVALAFARRNLAAHQGQVHVGDLWQALPDRLRGSVDVVAANAPYVPTDAIPALPAEARNNEPKWALDGGPDGLSVQRRMLSTVTDWLAPEGQVLVETGSRLAAGSMELLTGQGLAVSVRIDANLGATVVVGTRVP